MTYPVIDLSKSGLTGRDLEIAQRCLRRDGTLRASKPDPKKDGEAAYVWRLVAYYISPNPKHHCNPCSHDFDLPDIYWKGEGARERRRAREAELKTVIDAMCDCVPKTQWHGVRRWGRALGAL